MTNRPGRTDAVPAAGARADATRLLAAIVASSDDAIVSKSLSGVIQSWNVAAERMFGYSAAEAIGRHISLIIPPERLAEEDAIIAKLRAGERLDHYETERRRKDGGLIAVSLTISPVRDDEGQVVAASKIVRDITARKEAEAREHRLREATAETHAKFRAFFEQGQSFAGIMDLDGTIVEASRLSWEGCGFARGDVVGRKFWDGPWWTPAPELVAQVRAGSAEAMRGRTFQAEMRYFVAGGDQRLVDLSILPITDDAGRIVLLATTGTDITDRKRAEEALRESEERFRLLADNMSQFAWMTDASGWIFWYNRRWFDYTGTTLEQVQGWGWTAVHHPDHVDRVIAHLRRCLDSGQVWEDTFPLRGRDGEYRWFLSRAMPIRDEHGTIVRWLGTNTDITEQRRLAHDLRALSVELSDVSRRKDEFLAVLSHELRNPLAAVRSALAVVKATAGDGRAADEARAVMERQVAQMARLLDDLLDVSRITHDRLELQLADLELADVIRDAVDVARPVCERAGIDLAVELPARPLRLEADATRLAQVLGNLLANAAKYTPRGGRVDLAVEADDRDAVITVRDTGVGIHPAMLSRVFDMFAQVEGSPGRPHGGLGIGLSLVKRLVEMHGGTVTAYSDGPGRGSTFVVKLPLSGAAEAVAQPSGPADASVPAHLRVLVVDDDRDGAATLAMLLGLSGHDVLVARDGPQAIERAAIQRPDVVLLDIGLPGMDGREVCRRLRAEPWGEGMVIAAVTGWGQEADRRKTREAGFDRHLVKPVDPEALLRWLADGPTRATADPGHSST